MEDVLTTWQDAGAPPQSDFGMTVEADGTQRVWLGERDGPAWHPAGLTLGTKEGETTADLLGACR